MYFGTPEDLSAPWTRPPIPKPWQYTFEAEPRCQPHVMTVRKLR